MIYSLIFLNAFTAQKYKVMTFPYLQPLLENLGSDSSIVAIGATCSDQPIGLVLGKVGSDEYGKDSAEVLSIFVATSYRRRGISTALLTAMEDELHQRGCRKALIVYPIGKPTTPAFESLLQKCQWSQPEPRSLVYQSTLEKIMNAPWLYKYSLPNSFSTFLWNEITEDEKIAIQNKQEAERWYPEELSPFKDEDMVEPLNSLGLRYMGEVVGWMSTHRFLPDTIRYTALFVRKDLQRMGRAIPLLAEAIHIQNSSRIPKGIFVVDLGNERMCSFMKNRMAPYMTSITETRGAVKLLQRNTLLSLKHSA